MIQFETNSDTKVNSNESLKPTASISLPKPHYQHHQRHLSFDANSSYRSSLNKSDLYSPHINALKNMSVKEPTQNRLLTEHNQYNNDEFFNDDYLTGGDPDFYASNSNMYQQQQGGNGHMNSTSDNNDIYDFSNVRPSLLLDTSSNNPTDDEEEDINFDYGYGYDYERIIKDRLKIANSEFQSDLKEPSKPKSTLVSFDNAVTAFDIPNEDTADESEHYQPPKDNANAKQNEIVQLQPATSEMVSKLPLNDTVKKDQPDSFANKLREAMMRYDEMMNEQNNIIMQQQVQQQTDSKIQKVQQPLQENTTLTQPKPQIQQQQQQQSKTINNLQQKQKPTFNTSKSPSPILNTLSPELRNITKATNHKVLHIISDADKDLDGDISTDEFNNSLNKNISSNNNGVDTNKLKVSSPTFDDSSSSSFGYTITEKEKNPTTSPPGSPSNEKNEMNDQNKKKSNFSFSAPSHNNDMPSKDKSDRFAGSSSSTSPTKSPSPTQNLKIKAQEDESPKPAATDKMLIEKDGVFELMSAEEYTAYERKKALERTANNEKKNAAKKSLVPHPPPTTRPKTSTQPTANRYQSARAKLSAPNPITKDTTINNSLNSNEGKKSMSNALMRPSHSADPSSSKANSRNKSFSPINNHRTPEYAQNYKSPYQVTNKIYKPVETLEAKRQREKEEEERKRNNEEAFKKWLQLKEEQRVLDQKRKHNQTGSEKKQNSSNELSCTSSEEVKITFDAWLRRKRDQEEKEKEFQRKLEHLELGEQKTIAPEERSKAFKEWLSRKIREKNDALKQEKIEQKKWMSRRRRSRKHQRLTQALELAQAYGYNSSYYAPGFNF